MLPSLGLSRPSSSLTSDTDLLLAGDHFLLHLRQFALRIRKLTGDALRLRLQLCVLGLLCSEQTVLPLLWTLFQGRQGVATALGGTLYGDQGQHIAGDNLPTLGNIHARYYATGRRHYCRQPLRWHQLTGDSGPAGIGPQGNEQHDGGCSQYCQPGQYPQPQRLRQRNVAQPAGAASLEHFIAEQRLRHCIPMHRHRRGITFSIHRATTSPDARLIQ